MVCNKCAASLPDGSQFCLKCGQPVNSSASRVATATAEHSALACSKCGSELPDGAQFCLECGKPVSVPPKSGSAKPDAVKDSAGVVEMIPPPVPLPPRRRKRRLVLWILLAIIVVGVVWVAASDSPYAQGVQELVGWKHDQTVLDTPFSVSAHTFRYYKFALPQGSVNVAIVGQFTASDASKSTGKDADNNIEVYVLSEPAFTVWQNGYATSSVYESGRVSQGSVQAELPAGAGIYYLVFSNKFAPKTAKSVNASVLLRYKSWLPESFRRMKDRLWNWLAL